MAKKQKYCQREMFDLPGLKACRIQCLKCKNFDPEFNQEIEEDQDQDLEEDPDEPPF